MRTDALLSVISLSVLLTACGGSSGGGGTSNAAPSIAAATLTTNEDTSRSLALNASDKDGDSLSYSVSIAPLHGVATVDVDGSASYTPEANYHGTDSFTVSVSDGKAQASAKINVTVSSVNDSPVFTSGQTQNLGTNEDQPLSAQIAAIDVDGDELTFSLITAPQHGAAVITTTGNLTYTPTADFNGNDTLTVQVSDGLINTTATINVNIIAVNDAGPVFTNGQTQNLSTNEDQPLSAQIAATDVDGDELTFSLITTPQHGAAAITAAGSLTYTPTADFNGNDTLTVQVSDGLVNTTATINVNIIAVNDAGPVFTNGQTQNLSTNEDQPLSAQIAATDVDGDELTFSLITTPQHGAAVITTAGNLTYTPTADFNGDDTLTIQVSDGLINTTATINVDIIAVNDTPAFSSGQTQNLSTNEDQPLSAQIAATDVDGDELTFSLITTPQHGAAVITTAGNLTYTPTADFNGDDTLTIQVSDGLVNTTATINVDIIAINDAGPIFTNGQTQNLSTNEDQPLSAQIAATDVDGDELTFSLITAPQHGAAAITTAGSLTYTPTADFNGNDTLTVQVSDGLINTTATINVNIIAVNDTPAFSSGQTQNLSTSEDQPLSAQIAATDVDGDELSFSLITTPQHGAAVITTTGSLTYTPTADFNGDDTLTIQISDGLINTTATINVDIIAVNDTPAFSSGQTQNLSTNEDQPLSAQIAATDVDGDELSFSLITAPQHGAAVITTAGSLTYTPTADFNGNDTLTIQVSDGTVNTTANINFTINAVNDAPTMQAKSFTSYDAQTLNETINASDIDGDNLTFSQVSGQTLPGTVTFNLNNDGTFSYQNLTTSNTQVDIQVEVSDGTLSAQTTLSFATQTDPLLTQQWHLKNTGQNAFSASSGTTGHDINIGTLHIDGATGNGVKVAVVDSGLEIGHEDLSANVLPGRSYDYVNGDTDPTPTDNGGDHGTSVAGLIAAKGFNDIGGRGVAPNASLLGFNWLETQLFSEWQKNHGGDQTSDVQIINQSYGANIAGPQTFFDAWNNAAESHLKTVQSTNNAGKGIVMLKSAGNSFTDISTDMTISGIAIDAIASEYVFNNTKPRLSANIAGAEPESSSFYQTVISAVNANAADPLSSYSSVGASVWVSSPGGEYGSSSPAMITTDLTGCNRGYAKTGENGFNGNTSQNDNCNYTSTFNGTSSAAPVASGVAALIMEANDSLTWRDVRHIMAKTAKKIDEGFTPIEITNGADTFIAEPGWLTNAAGYHFHNWYGFGMVDATAAIALAKDPAYVALPAVSETAFIAPADTSAVTIPEGNTGASKTISIGDDLTVEAVQIKISVTHGRDADLAIELTSPAGTKSMVLQPRSLLVMDQDDSENPDFSDTVLLSNAFYGESSQGTWTIKVTDTNNGTFRFYVHRTNEDDWLYYDSPNNSTTGTLNSVSLRIYGH